MSKMMVIEVAPPRAAERIGITEETLREAVKVIHACGFVICVAVDVAPDAVCCEDGIVEAIKDQSSYDVSFA